MVEQAFQAWAGASGLTFKEVADSDQSDIRIGWGTFDTGNSGIVGYTSYEASAGQMLPDTIIRLEDPTQTGLVAGADGQLTYSGTSAELYQVLEHEIGHALGLADNSDPNSVMYFASGPSNRGLDATDTAGIQALYGPGSTAQSGASPSGDPTLDRMIQAMASLVQEPSALTSNPHAAPSIAEPPPTMAVPQQTH